MGGCGGLERTLCSTVSKCGDACDGLERNDFQHFLLWEWCEWSLKIPFFNSFYCYGWCDGLEQNSFLTVSTVKMVCKVVLKELIFNSFYFKRMWWS